jgi:glycosyltransferase involved in cell wall biosynthesis
LLPSANGGNAYDVQAAWALAGFHDVTVSQQSYRRPGEGMLSYWSRLRRIRTSAQVVVREPFPVVFGRFSAGVKYIAMIHHIDDRLERKSVWHRWYFSRLKKRLAALDLVVTVSDYWAGYLRSLGCRNVRVIHNSFDPSHYRATAESVSGFRAKFGLAADRPVVYIGNASRQKGVHKVYEALKDQGYLLVMSGPRNDASDLPVRYLSLEREDYLLLLQSCDAVICMSEMKEGWNRIAHEAMLCGTPVAGNGAGGMLELLEGGRQAVVGDPAELPGIVRQLLARREQYAADGRSFAERFNLDYFRSSWLTAVESLFQPPLD